MALRAQTATKEKQRWLSKPVAFFVGVLLLAGTAITAVYISQSSRPVVVATLSAATPPLPANQFLPTLEQLIAMSPEELSKVDIALMNLRCAEGLRGSENLNIDEALATIDRWAERVKWQTERYWYKFLAKPEDFENSEPFYRMLVLATVLQEDFGIRYDQSLATGFPPPNDDDFFDDSRNVLINGLTERQMGSCASLPVLYVAVGRRLGYPLKLIPTSSHLYLRWEDSRTRLNVEATSEGFSSYPDEKYWKWPRPVSPREAEKYEYFKSFSPADELACFLSARGEILMANDDYEGALKFHELAEKVSPHSELYRLVLKHVRPYVQYRRDFATKQQEKKDLATERDLLAEAARSYALQRKNQPLAQQEQNSFVPSSPIPPDPTPHFDHSPSVPSTNGFTPSTKSSTHSRNPTPHGNLPPTRAVPSATPRVR